MKPKRELAALERDIKMAGVWLRRATQCGDSEGIMACRRMIDLRLEQWLQVHDQDVVRRLARDAGLT